MFWSNNTNKFEFSSLDVVKVSLSDQCSSIPRLENIEQAMNLSIQKIKFTFWIILKVVSNSIQFNIWFMFFKVHHLPILKYFSTTFLRYLFWILLFHFFSQFLLNNFSQFSFILFNFTVDLPILLSCFEEALSRYSSVNFSIPIGKRLLRTVSILSRIEELQVFF